MIRLISDRHPLTRALFGFVSEACQPSTKNVPRETIYIVRGTFFCFILFIIAIFCRLIYNIVI